MSLLMGTILGYLVYPSINKMPVEPEIMAQPFEPQVTGQDNLVDNPTASVGTQVPANNQVDDNQVDEEPPFCKEYGVAQFKKQDLLEEFTTGPGDTFRSVALKALGDETRAIDIIAANPLFAATEVDDELPMNTKLYLPNPKYDNPEVTGYVKVRGNIAFNPDKPMFGVNGPNSGTGPFMINDTIKESLTGIHEGNCVVVVYGTRGFDSNKVVFEVLPQQ